MMMYYLVKHLSETNPLSENALIDYLDESSRGWESCILASSRWSFEYQKDLVSMLETLKKYLSVIASCSHRNCY